jgi:hypothetical protein
VIGAGRRQRLLALAAARWGSEAPEDVRRAGERDRMANSLRGETFALAQELVLDRLTSADIPAVPFKGVSAARRLDPGLGLRELNDIDVLVPATALPGAADALIGLGYAPPRDDVDAAGRPLLHLRLNHAAATLPPVELHWRVHWYEEQFSVDALDRARDRALDPLDELIVLLLCYARDGFLGLRLAADIAAWSDAQEIPPDPELFRARTAAYPAIAPALDAALITSLVVVGFAARPLLGQSHRRARLAARLRNPDLAEDRDQAVATMNLIDVLLAPATRRGRVIARHMRPALTEIADWYELPNPRGLPARLNRAAQAPKMLIRWLVALSWLMRRRV